MISKQFQKKKDNARPSSSVILEQHLEGHAAIIDSSSTFSFNFDITPGDGAEARRKQKKDRQKRLKSEKRDWVQNGDAGKIEASEDVELSSLQIQMQSLLTTDTDNKCEETPVIVNPKHSDDDFKHNDDDISFPLQKSPTIITNLTTGDNLPYQPAGGNDSRDVQTLTKISSPINSSPFKNNVSSPAKNNAMPPPLVKKPKPSIATKNSPKKTTQIISPNESKQKNLLRNTAVQKMKPPPLRFNTDSLGKAMVNHNSMAIHLEKTRAVIPQKAQDNSNKSREGSNAFSFGFDFSKLLPKT